ncbi:TPA: ABC transporter permease, partial [Thermoplasmata archaeon]|nr:ABC transporter permease [Thermoplasmata archaeon]
MTKRFEILFPRWTKKAFGFNPLLADKMSLSARNSGRIADLFLETWMGKVGTMIILFFIGVAVYAQLFMPYDRNEVTIYRLDDPSPEHPLGTDQLGRDVLTRIAHGTKASLTIGLVAMAISMGLGTLVGLASGFWGGWKDEVIMRINDVFLSIPWLVLMIVIAAVLGRQNLVSVIIVIGATGWSTTARIVRSQVLSLKARQFVERAKAIGAG